ncbi:MAG: UDP-3-O-(3-hydroxymyristoyl)glucosamine N-acyltransferase [Planctomycetes bacterium]|jgi:UDP-3-O-[3-hydroxymyristoyl] glucosamine N-acyltransferase|nr:UDP-3-O-(3-hydroxymyristoyl)glucosamine N-acyltransferase [Planctomycetota bacterium]
MTKTLGELAALVGGTVEGDPSLPISGACSAASGAPDRIAFAENSEALAAVLASAAGAAIVDRISPAAGKPLLRVDQPRAAFIAILGALHPEPRPAPGIHPGALVDPSAELGAGVSVGPHAVIEAGVVVGERSIVGAGSVLSAGSRIGPDCRLVARVVLYPRTVLGARVIVHAGAVIGSDGFGYQDTPEGKRKFPQVGTVVVGDDVEIGANTTIDRGAIDETVIGAGTKIDNLVQIAHNVVIGKHCAISAQCGIAGSTRIGDRVILGGQVGVADHVTMEPGTIVGAKAGIPSGKKLLSGVIYWGIPARPLAEIKQRHADLGRIPRLFEQLTALAERVKALGERGR